MIKKRIYFENLDGLRFFCFLSIFLYHSFYTQFAELNHSLIYDFVKTNVFSNGNIGVNFFFVLSGFLITYLLIEEKKINGQINLKYFWLRRILRIWPLFYFCVFIGFIAFPFIKSFCGQTSNEIANPIMYLLFLNNFDLINNGFPDSSILSVLWSVAIEEQFYFIWPIIVFLFPIKKLWIPFTIIILCNLIFRAFNDNLLSNEYHTLSCIGDMTIGAVGAWLIGISAKFKKNIELLSKFNILITYMFFIIIYFFRKDLLLVTHEIRIFERIILAVIILFIILEQTYSLNSFFKMSKFKTISKLGILTYGMYCLHFIGILLTLIVTNKLQINTHLWQVFFIETPIALFITIIISKVSYTYFETPFLKLKNKFSFISK